MKEDYGPITREDLERLDRERQQKEAAQKRSEHNAEGGEKHGKNEGSDT